MLATDSFFMAMFFFLSGLFVWQSIARKGPLNHLADRLRRLALPFVICAFTVIPLAYYAISLRQHPEIGFSEFWWTTITTGPMAKQTDLVPLGLVRFRSDCLPAVLAVTPLCSIRSIASRCTVAVGPPYSSRSCLLSPPRSTFPGGIRWGAGSWFEFGPFSVQHGRVLLYATYFFFGAGIGVQAMDRGVLAADGRMAKVGWDWMILTIVPYYLMWVLIAIKRENLGNPVDLPDWYEGAYAVCFTVLQRVHPVPDPGLFPEVRPFRQERTRSYAG